MPDKEQLRKRIGCALLNRPGSLDKAGFAAIDGQPSFKFNNVDELETKHPGVVWVTSAIPQAFIRGQGTRKYWLRDANFFTTSIQGIIEELGCFADDLEKTAQQVSEVLSRCLARAKDSCHINFPGEPTGRFSDLFADSIAYNASRDTDAPEVSAALQQILLSPYANLANPTGQHILVRLPLHRVAHMDQVLQEQVPNGAWHEVNLVGQSNPYAWVCSSKEPVMALVSLSKPKAGLGNFISKNLTKGSRTWMPHPELKIVGEFAEVKIEKVYCADEYVDAATTIAKPLPRTTPIDHASFSSGLFAEAFLSASCSAAPLSSLRNSPQITASASSSYATVCTPRSAWLLSAARVRVLKEASQLASAGFDIVALGIGHITIAVKRNEFPQLRTAVRKSENLLLPAKLSKKWRGTW